MPLREVRSQEIVLEEAGAAVRTLDVLRPGVVFTIDDPSDPDSGRVCAVLSLVPDVLSLKEIFPDAGDELGILVTYVLPDGRTDRFVVGPDIDDFLVDPGDDRSDLLLGGWLRLL